MCVAPETPRRCTAPVGLLGSYVGEEVDVAEGLRVRKAEAFRCSGLSEETLPCAHDDWIDLQVDRVHEVVLDKGLDELWAAVHGDVAFVLLLELRYFRDHVSPQNGGVVPLGGFERRGDDVLRHRVELVRELTLELWPYRRETVVRDPSEEQGVGRLRLLPFELVAVGSPREAVSPANPFEVLGSAGRLDDAVSGDVRGHNDPSHFAS